MAAASQGRLLTYDKELDFQDMGFTRLDSMEIMLNGQYIPVPVDQLPTNAGLFSTGLPMKITGAFIDSSPAFLARVSGS